jgi:putative Holliday junction resolvase
MTPLKTENSYQLINQKIMAVDYGTKVVGLAMFCQGKDPYPFPYGSLRFKSDDVLIQDLMRIVKENSVNVVIIGIPKLLDGQETNMTLRIMNFSEKLEHALKPLPLYRQEESLSTFEAEERMKNSPRYNFKVVLNEIDALSASIILEDFIKH